MSARHVGTPLLVCLIGGLVAFGGVVAAPGAHAQEIKDSAGDLLPRGAVGRLGTVRWRHASAIQCVAVSPDGKLVASGSADGFVHIWERPTGRLAGSIVTRSPGRRTDPWSLRFSPDGKLLVVWTRGNAATVYEASSGNRLWSVASPTPDVAGDDLTSIRHLASFAFAPDGKTAAAAEDRSVVVRDASTGRTLERLEGHEKPVVAVAFSPDARTLASGSEDGTVRLWADGKLLAKLEGHSAGVASVAFSPDGKTLASGSGDKTARLWEVASGKLLAKLEGSENTVATVAFSPDGTILASTDPIHANALFEQKAIRLWEVAGGKLLAKLESHSAGVASFALSPDGKTLASADHGFHTVRLWAVPEGKRLAMLDGAGSDVAFAPDGKTFVCAGGKERVLRFRDTATGAPVVSGDGADGHEDAVLAIAFSPDGKTLASSGADGKIALWELASGKLLATSQEPAPRRDRGGNPAAAVAFAPDGKLVATLSKHEIHLWERTAEGKLVVKTRLDEDAARSLAFSPDGKTLAAGHDSGSGDNFLVRLWDVATGKPSGTLGRRESQPVGLAFSPDGRFVAVTSQGVECFDVTTGKVLWRKPADWGPVAFAPDGKTLVSASSVTLHFWDAADGKLLFALEGHCARSIAFSPDGKRLATSGTEVDVRERDFQDINGYPTVRVWDVAGRKALWRARTLGLVQDVAFSPDGKTLAAAGADSTIVLWDPSSADLATDFAKETVAHAHVAAETLLSQATTLGRAKKSVEAVAAFEKVLEAIKDPLLTDAERRSFEQQIRYNQACVLALAGRKDDALAALERELVVYVDEASPDERAALARGVFPSLLPRWRYVSRDADLVSLHEEPRFKAYVAKLRALEPTVPVLDTKLPLNPFAHAQVGDWCAGVVTTTDGTGRIEARAVARFVVTKVEGEQVTIETDAGFGGGTFRSAEAPEMRAFLPDLPPTSMLPPPKASRPTGKAVRYSGGDGGERFTVTLELAPEVQATGMVALSVEGNLRGIHFEVGGHGTKGAVAWGKSYDDLVAALAATQEEEVVLQLAAPVRGAPETLLSLDKALEKLAASSHVAPWRALQLECAIRRQQVVELLKVGKKDEALAALERVVSVFEGIAPEDFARWEHGPHGFSMYPVWSNLAAQAADGPLKPLQGEPRFHALVERLGDAHLLRINKRLATEKPLFDYDFAVQTIEDKELKLADLKGRVVVVCVCDGSDALNPSLVASLSSLQGSLEREGLSVVEFACPRAAGLGETLTKANLPFPVAALKRNAKGTVDALMCVSPKGSAPVPAIREPVSRPTFLLIDREGKVRALIERPYAGNADLQIELWARALLGVKAADGHSATSEPAAAEPVLPFNPVANARVGDWAAGVLRITTVPEKGDKREEKAIETASVEGINGDSVNLVSGPNMHLWGGLGGGSYSARATPTVKAFLMKTLETLKPGEVTVADEVREVAGRKFATKKLTITPKELEGHKVQVTAWLSPEVKAGGLVAWTMTLMNDDGPGPHGPQTWTYEVGGFGSGFGTAGETIDWGAAPRDLEGR